MSESITSRPSRSRKTRREQERHHQLRAVRAVRLLDDHDRVLEAVLLAGQGDLGVEAGQDQPPDLGAPRVGVEVGEEVRGVLRSLAALQPLLRLRLGLLGLVLRHLLRREEDREVRLVDRDHLGPARRLLVARLDAAGSLRRQPPWVDEQAQEPARTGSRRAEDPGEVRLHVSFVEAARLGAGVGRLRRSVIVAVHGFGFHQGHCTD
jgi:hypothetical protein